MGILNIFASIVYWSNGNKQLAAMVIFYAGASFVASTIK
jgi:hypothetical protein